MTGGRRTTGDDGSPSSPRLQPPARRDRRRHARSGPILTASCAEPVTAFAPAPPPSGPPQGDQAIANLFVPRQQGAAAGRTGGRAGERGQSLVEFALALPLLILIVVGIATFGIAYVHYLQLTDAVRVGGRAAAAQTTSSAACNAATSAMQSDLGGDYGNIVQPVSCTSTTVNSDPAVTITAKWPFSISILGISYGFGNLTSSTTERLG